jgi:hypothetical protein
MVSALQNSAVEDNTAVAVAPPAPAFRQVTVHLLRTDHYGHNAMGWIFYIPSAKHSPLSASRAQVTLS